MSPTTCEDCLPAVVERLDRYRRTQDFAVVQELAEFPCRCRVEWQNGFHARQVLDLPARVSGAYELLGRELVPGSVEELKHALRRLRAPFALRNDG